MLIDEAVDFNVVDSREKTAFENASCEGADEMIKILEQYITECKEHAAQQKDGGPNYRSTEVSLMKLFFSSLNVI